MDLSLKPPKKSDLDKKWMKKRLDRAIKIQPEYHLIVTEGTDTEPEYFGSIKDVINKKYPEKIKLDVYGEGDNTISLFQKAKTRAEESSNVYKHVWIVYDTDDFPADHIDSVLQSCDTDSNDETTFHAVWSNQCIELWFLLHFSYMQSDIHREEYWPKLTECLKQIGAGEYEKNRKDMYEILHQYMEYAIGNAKRLNASNEGKYPWANLTGNDQYSEILLFAGILAGSIYCDMHE